MLPEGGERRLTGQVLKRSGGIDQTAVKKNPAGCTVGRDPVGKCKNDRASGEGGFIDPRQRRAVPDTHRLAHHTPRYRRRFRKRIVGLVTVM